MIRRGDIVCLRHDPRQVGLVRGVTWRTFGVQGLASIRWFGTGWLSTEPVEGLRPAAAPASREPGRFEFPATERI